MEIGDQRVDGTEREAGQDEDSGIAADRRDRFVQSLLDRGLRGGFERSRARRPDGDHAAARSFCPVDPRGGGPYIVEADSDGVVCGLVTSDLTIELVSQDITLEFGQTIQTSGLGGKFPSEIMIGEILNVNRLENELFQSASIQPAEDFSSLQAVLVVANFRPSNISPLEKKAE